MHLLSLQVLPLPSKHERKVVHAVESVGMLTTQHHLPQLERLPVYLLGLWVLPLAGEHECEVPRYQTKAAVQTSRTGYPML